MNAQDLRIGNYVMSNNGIWQLHAISDSFCVGSINGCASFNELTTSLLQPILLSPEILDKCDYQLHHTERNTYCWFTGKGADIGIIWVKDHWKVCCDIHIEIWYLHQLQNFFSITGNELDVKL